jgi:hypothetical protein
MRARSRSLSHTLSIPLSPRAPLTASLSQPTESQGAPPAPLPSPPPPAPAGCGPTASCMIDMSAFSRSACARRRASVLGTRRPHPTNDGPRFAVCLHRKVSAYKVSAYNPERERGRGDERERAGWFSAPAPPAATAPARAGLAHLVSSARALRSVMLTPSMQRPIMPLQTMLRLIMLPRMLRLWSHSPAPGGVRGNPRASLRPVAKGAPRAPERRAHLALRPESPAPAAPVTARPPPPTPTPFVLIGHAASFTPY